MFSEGKKKIVSTTPIPRLKLMGIQRFEESGIIFGYGIAGENWGVVGKERKDYYDFQMLGFADTASSTLF